jgi:hypothetical protein
MSLLNSYVCPKCGKSFPIFIALSQRIRRGPVLSWVKCSQCGATCQPQVSWKDAYWAWPLTIVLGVFLIHLFRTAPSLETIRHFHRGLYSTLFGVMGGTVFPLGIRRGFRLVTLQ